jgi:hypothetical protein
VAARSAVKATDFASDADVLGRPLDELFEHAVERGDHDLHALRLDRLADLRRGGAAGGGNNALGSILGGVLGGNQGGAIGNILGGLLRGGR